MILQAHNLKKTYHSPSPVSVLRDVSLEVAACETVAIQGRSGEGKSTLLHILGTLEEPDSGALLLNNEPVTRLNAPLLRNQAIGFIFQNYNLLDDLSALENVLLPLRIARKPVDEIWGIDLLDRVGLAHRALFPAKILSGGERQRVAIARALCNQPSLILADEPTGNLDRTHAQEIVQLLLSLNTALLLVTHDAELASLCARRHLLQNGMLTSAASA